MCALVNDQVELLIDHRYEVVFRTKMGDRAGVIVITGYERRADPKGRLGLYFGWRNAMSSCDKLGRSGCALIYDDPVEYGVIQLIHVGPEKREVRDSWYPHPGDASYDLFC